MKMKRRATKNAFTLIELLAVIVILAIIALIAVPVILNIIDKANKSAFKDTAYGIVNAGELYFAERMLDTNMISQNELITLPDTRLSLKGEVPTGKVAINTEGKVALAINNGRYCAIKYYDDTEFELTEDIENCNLYINGIMTSTNNCINEGTCPSGTKVNVQVNSNKNYNFYVVGDTDKLTLIMDRNLGERKSWNGTEFNDTSYGPLITLNHLNEKTYDWVNIEPIMSYTYNNNPDETENEGYKSLTITNGVAVLTVQNGSGTNIIQGTSRARLLTYEEVISENIGCQHGVYEGCPEYIYENLSSENTVDYPYGYWLLTTTPSVSTSAHIISFAGDIYSSPFDTWGYNGIRPVIELSK